MELGGRQVRWIDTPGLVWEADDTVTSAEVRARDILLRSKGRIDRLKDTSMASEFLFDFVELLVNCHPQFPTLSVSPPPKT